MVRLVCILFIFTVATAICGSAENKRRGENKKSLLSSDSEYRGTADSLNDGRGYKTERVRRGTTHKSYKSQTMTINGKKQTTLWYYNSAGPSYKIKIDGNPPAPRDEMIEWLEMNSHRYKVTPVPYKGDAEEAPESLPDSNSEPSQSQNLPASVPAQVTTPKKKKKKRTSTQKPVVTSSVDQFLPAECGLTGEQLLDKIVGGELSDIEETPWQVALVRRGSKSLSCGGSIISERYVVTAAHCFRSKEETDPEPIFVRKEDRIIVAGATNLRYDDGDEHSIERLFLHNGYTEETRKHDIALILISGKFVFGPTIFPVCLPSKEESFYPGRECKISGWGLTHAKASRTETKLRSADVKLTTEDDCKEQNQRSLPITSGMVCAGNFAEGGVDTCQGDSGGPLACKSEGRYKLFGVTSWGIGCADAKYPGVYTRVPKYLKWIGKRILSTMELKDRSALTDDDDDNDGDDDDDDDDDADTAN